MSTSDLVAELMALPDSPTKAAALVALPAITSGLVAVFAALLAGRE